MAEIPKKGELLIYFSAPWCGPCKQFGPLVERICKIGNLPYQKVLVDEDVETTYLHGVRSVPTIKLFRNGEIVSTAIGAMSEAQLKDWLNAHT